MAERSIILIRNKLHELESDLNTVLCPPVEPESGGYHQIIANDFHQRFIFLNHLLSAEIASQPSNADQLHEIERKLAELETAFHRWDDYQQAALAMENYLDETPSVCSDCAVTFFNDGELSRNAMRGTDGRFWGRTWREMGKYCGVFGCGIFMGAICVIGLWSCTSEYEAFLLRPT